MACTRTEGGTVNRAVAFGEKGAFPHLVVNEAGGTSLRPGEVVYEKPGGGKEINEA